MSDEKKTLGMDAIEPLLVLKQGRLRPANSPNIIKCYPGDKIKMSGMDKLDAIGQKKVTRDLQAKPPKENKRKAPEPGEVEFAKNPNKALAAALERLSSVLELLEKKLK